MRITISDTRLQSRTGLNAGRKRWVALVAERLPSWTYPQLIFLLLIALTTGCVTSRPAATLPERCFDFKTDTFAFANELLWEYSYDDAGHWSTRAREPKPDYTLHCFVLARTAVQFFENARFEPAAEVATDSAYRTLIRQVSSSSLRHPLPPERRIVIPGFRNLREFSGARPHLLKDECGGAWQSYLQRGNWRMIFPFTRRHQAEVAQELQETLHRCEPAIVHISAFPSLTINHAIVLYGAIVSEGEIAFKAYDPNEPQRPAVLHYDQAQRKFTFPANRYFLGGPVHVYRVYHRWNY